MQKPVAGYAAGMDTRGRVYTLALAHAIMTALLEDDLSGYELARDFETSLGFFWQASHQQIYLELRKLSDKHWLNKRERRWPSGFSAAPAPRRQRTTCWSSSITSIPGMPLTWPAKLPPGGRR